jgi:hypothetical protein
MHLSAWAIAPVLVVGLGIVIILTLLNVRRGQKVDRIKYEIFKEDTDLIDASAKAAMPPRDSSSGVGGRSS